MTLLVAALGAEDQVVTDILLDEAVAVVAADYRVGQVHVFDLGLQLTVVLPGDLRPKMTVILFGWWMVPLASSRRSPSLSSADRRESGCRRIQPARRTAGVDSRLAGALGR